jgi:type IV pilus assembly protein PilO
MDLNIDLSDIDLNNYGEWPAVIKGIAIAIIAIAVGYAWYHFHTKDQITRLDAEQQKEQQLRTSFETKQQRAVNLEAYRRQLADMEESFGAMLQQLPDKTEVPALLVDVSQTGLAAGLVFELFQPEPEQTRDFYAELPIRIRVTGLYHDFGRFISGLAALPRIVTIHDVKILPVSAGGRSNSRQGQAQGTEDRLVLESTLKTYRYLDDSEPAQ